MKRTLIFILAILLCTNFLACSHAANSEIATTTLPVYELTTRLCDGTGLTVSRIIAENVSCLHDYTLQPSQMKALEAAELTVCSGAGLEDFMADIMPANALDASAGISLLCSDHHEHSGEHHHDNDPHVWLSPENGKIMAENIYTALCQQFPLHAERFTANFDQLINDFDTLISYGQQELSSLSCNSLVTFHDGFAYMAEAYGLTVLHSMEEESGSEASAKELIAICNCVAANHIPAIFIERNGSDRAAAIVSEETGAKIYTLDTGMSDGYFDAMYHNIHTLKEALG